MQPPREFRLHVNDRAVVLAAHPQRSLLEVLREDLKLTGTKYGCGEGACGACAVLLDGRQVYSCTTPISEAHDKRTQTIEGLADGGSLHPVQQAFLDEQAFQCGHCTPGMIIAAIELLNRNPRPADDEIVAQMNPHLCRCCGYSRIVPAVQRAAELMRGEAR